MDSAVRMSSFFVPCTCAVYAGPVSSVSKSCEMKTLPVNRNHIHIHIQIHNITSLYKHHDGYRTGAVSKGDMPTVGLKLMAGA